MPNYGGIDVACLPGPGRVNHRRPVSRLRRSSQGRGSLAPPAWRAVVRVVDTKTVVVVVRPRSAMEEVTQICALWQRSQKCDFLIYDSLLAATTLGRRVSHSSVGHEIVPIKYPKYPRPAERTRCRYAHAVSVCLFAIDGDRRAGAPARFTGRPTILYIQYTVY